MATASFKIRKGKNKSIIYLQVQKGREFRLRQSTNIYIKNESLKFWDTKKERIKNLSNIPEAEYINGKLFQISKSVNDKILQLYKQRKLDKLSCKKVINEVYEVLQLKPKIRRIMWSRRAQEYDAKIFSGDPIKIAEVVRDLFRKNTQAEQSYSERQMFQIAIERLARELAAVEETDYFQSTEKIESILRNK